MDRMQHNNSNKGSGELANLGMEMLDARSLDVGEELYCGAPVSPHAPLWELGKDALPLVRGPPRAVVR